MTNAMFYDIPENFSELLTEKYEYASKNNFVIFNGVGAHVEIDHHKLIEDSESGSKDEILDVEYTVYDPKFAPKIVRPEHGTVEKNPFAKPEPELTILDKFGPEDEFRVVFNKFPLVERHFMIVTNEFKPQQTPLSTTELTGIYTILNNLKQAKSESEHDWIAFYNCGPQSGASQPHKHAQFMTLPSRENYTTFGEVIADGCSEPFIPNDKEEPLSNPLLPFAHFVAKLPESISDMEADDLSMYFGALLQRGLTVIKENDVYDHISYNCIMTTKYMLLVPRAHSKYKDTAFGLNSLAFVGLILCREPEYLDICHEVGPDAVLKEIGFPNTNTEHSEEFKY